MKIRNSILLILTAFIWGVAFVAQQEGGEMVGPYSFNGIRSFMGGLVLLPILAVMGRKGKEKKSDKRTLILGGCLCGCILFAASTVQQLGIYYGSGVGKAGFLTSCYILIVPILGLFLKKRCGINIWIGVLLALVGLYLLCIKGSFMLEVADILLMICALLFALHILVIDYFSPKVNGVAMSCIQFFVCGFLSLFPIFFGDMGSSLEGIQNWVQPLTTWEAWLPILYGGVMSCGVAYTLQIVGQNGVNPTIASLLMSLESVFSVLAGWVLLGEALEWKELLGCGLIFAAIILAQLPSRRSKAKIGESV